MSENKTKHTPGPWELNKGCYKISFPEHDGANWDGDIEVVIPYARRSGSIVYGSERLGEEMQANARLIAAAPELLEALKQYRSQHEAKAEVLRLPPCECSACRLAIPVIAKVEGVS